MVTTEISNESAAGMPSARICPSAPSDRPAAPAAREAAPAPAVDSIDPDADEAVICETAIECNALDLLSRLVAESETASKVEVTKDEIASLVACFKQMREAGGGTAAEKMKLDLQNELKNSLDVSCGVTQFLTQDFCQPNRRPDFDARKVLKKAVRREIMSMKLFGSKAHGTEEITPPIEVVETDERLGWIMREDGVDAMAEARALVRDNLASWDFDLLKLCELTASPLLVVVEGCVRSFELWIVSVTRYRW